MKINFHNWHKIVIILLAVGVVLFAMSGYMDRLINIVLRPLIGAESWFDQRVQAIKDYIQAPRMDILELEAENQNLRDQITILQDEILQLQQDLSDSDILYALLGYARGRAEESHITCYVIGKDPSPFMQYILIDKGSDDGVLYNMPVVTNRGLVGRITAVTASAARVQLITDAGSMVNAVVEGGDNTEVEGMVTGSITGDVTIEMVSPDADLETGQVIRTSGLGGDYPADLMIGQVLNVNTETTELFKSASIQPNEDFAKLEAVLVISDFRPSNIDPLE